MIKHLPPRTLHIVDIENLAAEARPDHGLLDACRSRYLELVSTPCDDLVVVGCNHGALLVVGYGWPDARVVVRSGSNGADLALLDVLEHERVDERFSSVVLGSGDGIFAEAAARLRAAGCRVTVVSRPEALSRRLRLVASGVVTFALHPTPAPAAVARDAA